MNEKKTQIIIAHQKERIDRTKKVRLAAKKKYSWGIEDFVHIFGKLTNPYVMFDEIYRISLNNVRGLVILKVQKFE